MTLHYNIKQNIFKILSYRRHIIDVGDNLCYNFPQYPNIHYKGAVAPLITLNRSRGPAGCCLVMKALGHTSTWCRDINGYLQFFLLS